MGALLAIPLGLLIGAILGLVGAGGSIIAVPALVYGVGLSPGEAIPSSLIIVGLAALTAVLPRIRSNIDWNTAFPVGLAGIPATWLGATVNGLLNPNMLMLAFAALMVAAATRMLATNPTNRATDSDPGHRRRNMPKALLVGVIVGFLTGLLGIGGGFIITPALILLLGLPTGTAVGTSLVIIVLNSISGFTSHLSGLELNWIVVLLFSATAIIGSLIASRYATRLPDRIIKMTFAIVVLTVAAFVAISSTTALVTT
ncbi:sulfite exporter TauE/SafE family protein [Planctomonas deserti]|uniref:sulfite exporter TauE/SafE family protein n=1 Tax=Planctomonas deserti TaxID=2144185 RepID=UPI000D3732DA|nr:sulfite exporter TauE/SafE family protein [Planctomonas deserti]